MRNSQYYGLMWVLSAIAASVISIGTIRGIFVLTSVVSVGFSIYFFAKETGLLDESLAMDEPQTAKSAQTNATTRDAPRAAARTRERSAQSPEERQPPRQDSTDTPPISDAVIFAYSSAETTVTDQEFVLAPPRLASDRANVVVKESPAPPRKGLPVGGAVARGENRRRSVTVESPLSWIKRALGRGS